MSALLPPSRKTADGDRNLIPMINVVFLLLIFFMIAGQISAFQPGEIALPTSASSKAVEAPTVTISMTLDQLLTLDDQPLSSDELTARLQQMADQGKLGLVAVKADRQLSAADLDRVLAPLRTLGVARVTLFSQQQEQP